MSALPETVWFASIKALPVARPTISMPPGETPVARVALKVHLKRYREVTMRRWFSGALRRIDQSVARAEGHQAEGPQEPPRARTDAAPILAPSLVSEIPDPTQSETPSTATTETVFAPSAAASVVTDFDIYHQYPPHVLYTFRDRQALVNDALRAYTAVPVQDEPSGLYSDPIRVLNFFQLIQQANCLPSGDYLELGSHRGFSTRVIHRFMDPTRTLYAFDTFEGFDGRDIEIEREKYDSSWQEGGFGATSVELVARYVGDGSWPANLKLVQGWFPDSFECHKHRFWRFVHVDFDLYQPIKTALETVWDRVLPGGVIVVHDYGCYGFPGARMAVDEFCQSVGVPPIEMSDRWSSAVFRKPFAAG